MRPELDETLAAPASDPAHTATAPRAPRPAGDGLAAGQQLGHFRVERPLGAGGMGEVYLATDLALERPVALKVLPAAAASDPLRRDRLVREARAQARVNHPNVGHIYFVGEHEGRLYFAMEYVAGQTVGERLAAGPLPVNDALAIIRSAALGLREAQRSGITHRDVKPSNLMIDAHGLVKVLDFGLAADTPGAAGELASGPVAQTSLGGTPLYMAPEQARGEPIDLRADIYALGATLFHLVAGRPPFEADDLGALLTQHASAARPTVPRRGQARTQIAAVDALCGRMMAPAAADRFASYDELIRAIELASAEHIRPAGLWVRAIATGVDLLVSLAALGLSVVLPLALIGHRDYNGNLSVFVIYVVLATVLVARTGRTPGKWLLELEVVDVDTGQRPAWRRAALRALVMTAGPLIAGGLGAVLGHATSSAREALEAALLLAPVVALGWAALRSVSKRTVWDRLSHTIVRYRMRRASAI
jgi:eukaryotic-like serine/threonine-protein kinase